ncbi:hypothetical protein CYLTODRAFT_486539 [Cylindrobasidium torrendii FP15055 ss-10]|uniref:ER membrane protein complex subunit 7 beta-sandwich domain-containing protein n=1 Tax=Cylindrobasidium torrendii FP15055 ss-10 TaxID=1314674 RepID=A0A0D7BR86_9AGAR|nr:hypothetical protein CYLTODRAFT_486539 [Cylindrobasidium torrendii FP15055 ss-10]
MLHRLLSFMALLSLVWAVDVSGRIRWNDACPNFEALGPTRVTLDRQYSANIIRNGTFTIYDVPEGVYIFSVLSHDFVFDEMRVDVLADSLVEVRPYALATRLNPPAPRLLSYPMMLFPRSRNAYFVQPESFDITSMLKSPMILMMLVTGGLVLGMPYLMKNMDPEQLEEFKEQQARMAKMQSAMTSGDFKSGLSALMTGGEEPEAGPSKAIASPPTKAKGKPKKK